MTPEQLAKCSALYQLQTQLRALKEQEMALRTELAAELFPEVEELQEGTFKTDVKDGWKLVLQTRNNRKLEAEGLNAMLDDLEGEKGRELVQTVTDLVVPYKPELKWGEFKKAPAWFQDALFPFIRTSPGAPTLSFEMPKAPKAEGEPE